MPERTRWLAVCAALLAGIVGGASIGKMPPALPFLQDEFSLSLIAAGWLVSMFNVIAIAGAVFFGLISDRLGALRFCLFGIALQVAGAALALAASGSPLLLASRMFEGVGYVSTVVAAPVLMAAAASPSQRGLALGLWGTHMPIGGALMVALSPPLLAAWSWQGVWVSLLAVMLACALLLLTQRRHYAGLGPSAPRSLASIRSSLAQPVPWLLGTAFACYTLMFYTVMVWLPTYLLQTHGTAIAVSSLLTAAYILANALGNALGSWYVHWGFSRGRVIGATFAANAVLFIGVFSPELSDSLRYAFVLVYGFVTGSIPPAVVSGVMRYARSPAEAGSLQGLNVQLSNVGTFVAPPIIATAVTLSGDWGSALWVLLVAAALGLAVAWRIHAYEAGGARNARGGAI